MGMNLPQDKGRTAATIIPSVGCPMGCNFCTTSAFFGGKGKFLNFYNTGEELFGVMSEMESKLNVKSFFVMDENFLLHKRRAMELLGFMKAGQKPWSLYVFSSANAINQYTMRELVELGVSWVWMGLESPHSQYTKLQGADTRKLAAQLRQHGIKLLGSTIVGLEHHTPQNIEAELEHAVAHNTDFHQFMLYTPVPGTPLYAEMNEQGRMLPGIDLADIHGQDKFNFQHAAHFARGFETLVGLGLSPRFRTQRTQHLPHLPDHDGRLAAVQERPDPRVRARFQWEARSLRDGYAAALWAMEKHLRRTNEAVSQRIRALRKDVGREFGLLSRVVSGAIGPVLLWNVRREERRLARGETYEPRTIIERRNWDWAAPLILPGASPAPGVAGLTAQEQSSGG